MKITTPLKALALAGVALPALCLSTGADASSHREAPGISGMPELDATDFYMFQSYETGRSGYTTIIADYDPLQDPFGGPNYFTLDPHGYYDINIDNTGSGTPAITFRFLPDTKNRNIALTIAGTSVPVALTAVGPVSAGANQNLNVIKRYQMEIIRAGGAAQSVMNPTDNSVEFKSPTDYIGKATFPNGDYTAYAASHIYNVSIPGCGNGRVFVGPRKDPFVVNLGETFDLLNIAHPVGNQYEYAGTDALRGKNVTAIVLEVPTSCLVASDPVVGGWTTAGKVDPTTGALTQYSRLGNPLVNEVVVGLPDKDAWNASSPSGDSYFAKYVTNPTFPAIVASVFSGAGVVAPTLFPRTDLEEVFLTGVPSLNKPATVTPAEEMRLNTSIAPVAAASQNNMGVLGGDTAGYPNGRRPGDSVVDITLRVAMGALLPSSEAPSGQLQFTNGAYVDSSFFDTAFPYLKGPLPGSPGAVIGPGQSMPPNTQFRPAASH